MTGGDPGHLLHSASQVGLGRPQGREQVFCRAVSAAEVGWMELSQSSEQTESRLAGWGLHRAEGVFQPTWPLRDGGIFPLEPGGGGRPVGIGPPEAVLCGHGGHVLVPWTRSSGLG